MFLNGLMVLLDAQFPSVNQRQSSKDFQNPQFVLLTCSAGNFTCLLAHD